MGEVRMTVSDLREALIDFPGELEVVMRTYHKADICPIVEVAQKHYEHFTRVELRMKKLK